MGDLPNVKRCARKIFGSATVMEKCAHINFSGTFLRFRLSKDIKTTLKEERIMKTIAIIILAIVVCTASAWAGGRGECRGSAHRQR
jgi:hypothetical protein